MAKQTIDELAIIISANASKLGPDLSKAKKDFEKFSKDVAAMPAPPPKPPDLRHLRQAHKEAAAARASVKEAAGSVLGFAGKVAATAGTLIAVEAGISGVAGAFAELKDSVRMAADLEQTKIAFEVLIGDARRAGQIVAEVRQFAASTPFNTRELTDATRQLVAYGRSADVVVDELRMLGDVSAAMGDRLPIGELTYLYGTLYAQQRAFTKDLYQFAGRGIPIWRELGKVTGKTGDELRTMVEDGRIGFEDIRQAFVNMTSAGGQFYGMTARQGQSVAGVIEQMKDSFQLLKIEVGQVLIDELGLKDAAKGLEAFAGNLRENVGEIRPAVKFVGDLAKAGAQVGYEFTRAGVSAARMNLTAYADAIPELRQAAALVSRIAEDGAKFKLNEKDVIDAAFAFGKVMATNVVSTGKQVALFGEGMAGMFELVVKSAREARDYMRGAAEWVNKINDALPAATKFLASPITLGVGSVIADIARARGANEVPADRRDGAGINPARIDPPVPGMSADRIRAEYFALSDAIIEAGREVQRLDLLDALRVDVGPQLAEARAALAGAHQNRGQWVHGGFEGDAVTLTRRLDGGDIPPIRGAAPAAPSDALSQVEQGLRDFRQWIGGIQRLSVDGMVQELERARVRTQEARAIRELDAGSRALVASLRVFPTGNPLHDAAANAMVGLPAPRNQLAQSMASFSAGLGGPGGLFRVDPPPIPPDISALVGDIRRQYDPRRELDAYRAQLDQIQSRGLMGANTDAFVSRAWRDKLGEVAGKLGIDNHRYQLPEATAVGTAEDARIVNAWRMEGQRPATTESLLKQILDVVAAQLAIEQQRGKTAPPPIPRIVQLPGE